MSKFESINSPEATPVEAEPQFSDPALQEAFASKNETTSEEAEVDFETSYREQLTSWREAKAEYQAQKSAYNERLADYYQDYSKKSIFGRGSQKLGEWWNGQPDDLTSMEEAYKSTRSKYAQELQEILHTRGELRDSNVDFDTENTQTKTAFAEKFILRPKAEQLAVEKEHLLDSETVEQAQKVLQTLAKHKWTIRVGAVTVAGVVVGSGAGAIAGLGAAGFRAARIAGGVAGGTIGAHIGNRSGTKDVEAAQQKLTEAEVNSIESFSVTNIDALESALTKAEETVDASERTRKYKIIAGALLGGGSLANIDNILESTVSTAEAQTVETVDLPLDAEPSNTMMENPHLRAMFDENLARAAADAEVTETPPVETTDEPEIDFSLPLETEPSNTMMENPHLREMFDRNIAAAAAEAEAGEIAAEAMEVLQETAPEAVPVGDHVVEGGDTLWKITGESFADQLEGLSETQQNQVLDAVFDDLRQNPDLVRELGIRSGNVDLIYPQDTLQMSLLSDLVAEKILEYGPSTEPSTAEAGSVAVESKDTLWDITAQEYQEELSSLTEEQKNQTLSNVMQRIQAEPAVMEQLGISSGNVDTIFAGEDRLQMDILQPIVAEEATRVLEGVSTIEPASPSEAVVSTPEPVATTELEDTPAPEVTPTTQAVAEDAIETSEQPPVRNEISREAIATASLELGLPPSIAQEALRVFGTTEAFAAAKLDAIEDLVGEQANSWGGGERFNPVFEALKGIPLQTLQENNLHLATQLEQPYIDQFLGRMNMDLTDTNRHDLQIWHSFYRDSIQPNRLEALELEVTPTSTVDDLFSKYVIRTAN